MDRKDAEAVPVEYRVYANMFAYINTVGFVPVAGDEGAKKDVTDFIKTMQFYSHVKIKAVGEGGKVMYMFIVEDSIVSKFVKFKGLLNMIPEKEARLVVVSKGGIGTAVAKAMRDYKDKRLTLKDLTFDLFKANIRGNVMVPEHRLCSEAEKKEVMERNGMGDQREFPTIRATDAQVLSMGGESGQLVEIVRASTIGRVVYYRLVH